MPLALPWIILITYVAILLAIDMLVLNRKHGSVTVRQAALETAFFVLNALLFTGVVYWAYASGHVANHTGLAAPQAVLTYLTGYIIELSLSVDNLFVMALIFTSFKVQPRYQHKLLFLGIVGALVFRAIVIAVGIGLVQRFQWLTMVFGAFLLFTAFRTLKDEAEHHDVEEPKGISRYFHFRTHTDDGRFFTRINNRLTPTALLGALITIEFTDLLFALDSIPAIFAVTTDPFLVYSSNIFAIMGLRSLYFFLANMLQRFIYLKYSVFAILLFVAIKLMAAQWVHLPEWFSLVFIISSLAIGVYVSLARSSAEK
jgi:tellurite resistance protein TerC